MTKKRKTVNVSIQKRNYDKINDILNSWEEDGCNISNKICEAILFKESSKDNPHILTILSTLNLIESSLKANHNLSEEELSLNTTEIFKQVLTLNIDGDKLTTFLTGKPKLIRKDNINKENTHKNDEDDICNSNDENDICNSNIKNTTDSIEKNQYSNNETSLNLITNNTKNTNTSSDTNNLKKDDSNMIVWTNFPDDKNLKNNKSNKDLNDVLGAFICNN